MHPRVATTEFEVRHVGVRYDDDINSIELKPFTVVGATVQRPLTHRITAYVRVENLLDEVYEISRGTNGLAEVGGPRWVMVGVRSRW
jgi:outer membrane cobalamin receptor